MVPYLFGHWKSQPDLVNARSIYNLWWNIGISMWQMESRRASCWPQLYFMVFHVILTEAFQGFDNQRIKISYRTEARLCNHRRLQASTKTRETKISNLTFADDCALAAMSECDMQPGMDKFSSTPRKRRSCFRLLSTQHITTQELKLKAASFCRLIVSLI